MHVWDMIRTGTAVISFGAAVGADLGDIPDALRPDNPRGLRGPRYTAKRHWRPARNPKRQVYTPGELLLLLFHIAQISDLAYWGRKGLKFLGRIY